MARVRSRGVVVNVRTDRGARVTVNVNVSQGTERPNGLRFGKGNAKLGKDVRTFSLPAGHSCPFAEQCMARADRQSGKITDGPHTVFRCFAASDEARRKEARAMRWHNYGLLRGKSARQMAALIEASLPNTAVVRIHVSGDFFSLAYLDAWLTVAQRRPEVLFYFYAKSLRYWAQRLAQMGDGHTPEVLSNVVPTASYGGRDDALIEEYGLRSTVMVYSESEAQLQGLRVDHDDGCAMAHGSDFALLLHGSQPGGSEAAKALATLRADGEYGYGEKADARRATRRTALALA